MTINRQVTLESIDFDIDNYLVKGGKLLDIIIPSTASDQHRVEAQIGSRMMAMSPEERERVGRQIARFGTWLQRVRQVGPPETVLGNTITEEHAIIIWRGTAEEP